MLLSSLQNWVNRREVGEMNKRGNLFPFLFDKFPNNTIMKKMFFFELFRGEQMAVEVLIKSKKRKKKSNGG
jgi:hypothetical protein